MVRYIINRFFTLDSEYEDAETVFRCNGHVCDYMHADDNLIMFRDEYGSCGSICGEDLYDIDEGWSYIVEFDSAPAAGTGWGQFIANFEYIMQIPDVLYTYKLKKDLTYTGYLEATADFISYDTYVETLSLCRGITYNSEALPEGPAECVYLLDNGESFEVYGSYSPTAPDDYWYNQSCRTLSFISQPTDDLLQFLIAVQGPQVRISTSSTGKPIIINGKVVCMSDDSFDFNYATGEVTTGSTTTTRSGIIDITPVSDHLILYYNNDLTLPMEIHCTPNVVNHIQLDTTKTRVKIVGDFTNLCAQKQSVSSSQDFYEVNSIEITGINTWYTKFKNTPEAMFSGTYENTSLVIPKKVTDRDFFYNIDHGFDEQSGGTGVTYTYYRPTWGNNCSITFPQSYVPGTSKLNGCYRDTKNLTIENSWTKTINGTKVILYGGNTESGTGTTDWKNDADVLSAQYSASYLGTAGKFGSSFDFSSFSLLEIPDHWLLKKSDGNNPFSSSSITTLVLPPNVTKIGSYGLGVNKATSYTIPASCTYLDDYAITPTSSTTGDGGTVTINGRITHLGEKCIPYCGEVRFANVLASDIVEVNESGFLVQGTSKASVTYNIYTDNVTIKNNAIASRTTYTTVNVFHLDGTAW